MIKKEVIDNLKLKIKNKKRGRKSLSGSGSSPFVKVALSPEIKTGLEKLSLQENLELTTYIRIILEGHVSENAKFLE